MKKYFERYVFYTVQYGSRYQRADAMQNHGAHFDTLEQALAVKNEYVAQGFSSVKVFRFEETQSCSQVRTPN